MENLIKTYQKAFKELPKEAKTKITKSALDRGGAGVFTKRRKRNDVVLIYFESFSKNYNYSVELLTERYIYGWRILCSPKEYFDHLEILNTVPTVVRYQHFDEIELYPAPIEWGNISNNRKDYEGITTIFVQDIKNLDKFGKKGKSVYIGPEGIGQNEFDFAYEDEISKVRMVLLYQMIKMIDFYDEMNDNINYSYFENYKNNFENSELYLDNPNLRYYSSEFGYTVCPELIKFPNKRRAYIKFADVINGKIEGDLGREEFNRTTTKVNLHHVDKLIAGKLNHNHKNVFLGTEMGNSINAALERGSLNLQDLMSE